MPNIAVLWISFTILTCSLWGVTTLLPHLKTMWTKPTLLTDPFLQLPTPSSVNVVWFTEFEGTQHTITYGESLGESVVATTTRLSRLREDQGSYVNQQEADGSVYSQPTLRPIWRHEATISNLSAAQRVPYYVTSTNERGQSITSERFTLAPLPSAGTPLKILLTSDHQLMPMTPANLQMVEETISPIDAIFLAGDLVNIPDRASEWFDDARGRAFFPALQGRASAQLGQAEPQTTYRGGSLIQSTPLFTAIGNHEVMGRWSMEQTLREQFNDPVPRAIATQWYQENATVLNPENDDAIMSKWITDQSFNTITYDEIFSLPKNEYGHSKYYAVTIGDVRLVVLYATNIWRTPSLDAKAKGRYREPDMSLEDDRQWGYGQHIFEPIHSGSQQYQWLESEVRSPAFVNARYKVVMLHHPPHTLGDNIVPAYTDPVQIIDRWDDSRIKSVRYEYPKHADYLIRDVIPLLDNADVDLVFFGHSHLWNRFTNAQGTHFLEASNVGNTYGAFWKNGAATDTSDGISTVEAENARMDQRRPIPIGYVEDYAPWNDPNGLIPVVPTIAPMLDKDGNPQPFIASNNITVFSILDTGQGTVASYRMDTQTPDRSPVKFDEFSLGD
ncbi:MAG: metallophosphoesterase [Symploca sp. SIO2B6]|nr:metallophosphoesterase [Symploca sp. SIO2B6]